MGRDIHEVRKYADEADTNPAARPGKSERTAWKGRQSGQSRGARIGAFYAKKFHERIYGEKYLGWQIDGEDSG